MSKNKLKLKELKVVSFTTSLKTVERQTIIGGAISLVACADTRSPFFDATVYCETDYVDGTRCVYDQLAKHG